MHMKVQLVRFMNYFMLALFLLTLVGCDRHSDLEFKLDTAEQLMQNKPDSALYLLSNIPASKIKGKRYKARYALLKSIALDKNYIDTTSFEVIQPAIDYYLDSGNADEKLRTLYYQGRIFQNQGADDEAMSCFMKACDLKEVITDTLVLANAFVSEAMLYYKQYKLDEFIKCHIKAAELYKAIGNIPYEIKSYTIAADGYTMKNNKLAADSLIHICFPLVKKNKDSESFLFNSILLYTLRFGTKEEIRDFLSKHQHNDLSSDDLMDFAKGYTKLGEYAQALHCLQNVELEADVQDSLKYITIKLDIFKQKGDFKNALRALEDYTAMHEDYMSNLLSRDLLFADQKHQLEMKRLKDIQNRDRIIWGSLCGLFGMLLFVGWLYYRDHINKTMRLMAEKENQNLKLAQENLCKEKEKAELERDKKTLETANLKLEIAQLENERDNLMEYQREQSELSKPIHDVINVRLDMLNSLLAKEIANNDIYAKPYVKWIESIHHDKKEFMDSTRLAFKASHPKFISYLEQRGITTDEINYLCLYAIGLRGKEVGEYIQVKRHYNISSEIRKKLGIDEHETNIGLYIRRLLKDL